MKSIVSISTLATILGGCALNDPAQKVSVTANVSSSSIDKGDALELTWSSKDAKACAISDSSGVLKQGLPTEGKESLTPTTDQTYTVSCDPAVKGDKAGSASIAVKLFDPPSASIESDKAQIYSGEKVDLKWSAKNAEDCTLSANGQQIAASLSLTGSNPYSPTEDTSYELTCTNARGKKAAAKAQVAVIAELDVKPVFDSLAALSQALEISAMTKDCGPSCIYVPYDSERFNDDGSATELLKTELRPLLTKANDKVYRPGKKQVGFDSTTTFAYGHVQGLVAGELSERCEAVFPYDQKNAVISAQFSEQLDGGIENLGSESLALSLVDGIEVSAKALRGVMKAGTEATLSYKLLGIDAQRQADFMDYEGASGGYTVDSVSGKISPVLTSESFQMLRSFPEGYPVPPAANGYAYDPKHDTCSNPVPKVTNKRVFNSPGEYCAAGSPFQGSLACEVGISGGLPSKWPYTYYYNTNGQPFSAYAQPVASQRVVSQLAQVQCKKWLSEPARVLGLDDNWTVMAETQFFITDSRWPGCGSNCAVKEERADENDWRFGDIEPGKNFCVDRWAGLNWNQYRARIEAACMSTQLYKDAYAKAQQQTADEDFARECNANETCRLSLQGMKKLSDMFSVQALNSLLTKEEAAMNKAKSESKPYLISEAKLAPGYVASALSEASKVESGLPLVNQIHAAKKSTWTGGNLRVHTAPSVPGFDSATAATESVLAYKDLLQRANNLVKTDIRALGCKFEVTQGRYRRYSVPKIGEVAFPVKKQETVKTKIISDTTVN